MAKNKKATINPKNNDNKVHDLHVQKDTLLLAEVFENLETNILKYMN